MSLKIEIRTLLNELESTKDPELLDKYADHANTEIRTTVALNNATSKDTMFRRLNKEEDESICKLWHKKYGYWYRHKKHHIDANLGDETVRFYPRRSSVHGFNYECPKSWDHYYKEYLSFSILYQDEYMKADNIAPEIVFKCECDECSRLVDLNVCLYLWLSETDYKDEAKLTMVTLKKDIEVKNEYHLITHGYGVEWKIKRNENYHYYTVIPYLNHGPQKAYFLEITEKELLTLNNALAEYLNECIKNSESI